MTKRSSCRFCRSWLLLLLLPLLLLRLLPLRILRILPLRLWRLLRDLPLCLQRLATSHCLVVYLQLLRRLLGLDC